MTLPSKKASPLDDLPEVSLPRRRPSGHPLRSSPAGVSERIVRSSLHLPHSVDAAFKAAVIQVAARHRADKSKVLRALIQEFVEDESLRERVTDRLERA